MMAKCKALTDCAAPTGPHIQTVVFLTDAKLFLERKKSFWMLLWGSEKI